MVHQLQLEEAGRLRLHYNGGSRCDRYDGFTRVVCQLLLSCCRVIPAAARVSVFCCRCACQCIGSEQVVVHHTYNSC
jgi:hypothetical protein